jgi:hypothetical protein
MGDWECSLFLARIIREANDRYLLYNCNCNAAPSTLPASSGLGNTADLNQEAEIDGDEKKDIDAEEDSKGGVKALPLRDCRRHTQNKDERYRDQIEWSLGEKVSLALQHGIDEIDER